MGETVLEGKVLHINEYVEAAELKASASAALAVVSGGVNREEPDRRPRIGAEIR